MTDNAKLDMTDPQALAGFRAVQIAFELNDGTRKSATFDLLDAKNRGVSLAQLESNALAAMFKAGFGNDIKTWKHHLIG